MGLPQGTQAPLATAICQLTRPAVGRFYVGSLSFLETPQLRLRVQQVSSSPHPFGPMGRSLLESPGPWAQHSCLPRPPPGCFLCPLCPCPVLLALPTRLGLCCPIPPSLLMLLLIVALEVYRAGWACRGLGTEFLLCVRICPLLLQV